MMDADEIGDALGTVVRACLQATPENLAEAAYCLDQLHGLVFDAAAQHCPHCALELARESLERLGAHAELLQEQGREEVRKARAEQLGLPEAAGQVH
jgi:hypothetical protein